MKEKIVFMIFSVFIGFSSGSAVAEETKETHKPHQHRHDQYTHMKNPVPGTVQSIAEGKKLYEKHCMACHGESGKGGAGSDLTDTAWIHGDTDGEIFNAITGAYKARLWGFSKKSCRRSHGGIS
jgi:cytochrome c1